jgi:hypothetical protein
MFQAYQQAVDHLNHLREQLTNETDETRRAELRQQLPLVKERMCRLFDVMDRDVRETIEASPIEMRFAPQFGEGTIAISQSVRGLGGKMKFLRPVDKGYDEAIAKLERWKAVDALVAELAYELWTPWRGPVHIDYFGHGNDAMSHLVCSQAGPS